MKHKYKIIALTGKTGCGKSSILNMLRDCRSLNIITHTTTRPKRDNETNGIDYHFITQLEFAQKLMDSAFVEATVFNSWGYATAIEDLDENKWNVGIFSPEAIEILLDEGTCELKIFLIETSPKERLMRCLNRESNPDVNEIIRRYQSDEKDYNMFQYMRNIIHLINETQEDKSKCVEEILNTCKISDNII